MHNHAPVHHQSAQVCMFNHIHPGGPRTGLLADVCIKELPIRSSKVPEEGLHRVCEPTRKSSLILESYEAPEDKDKKATKLEIIKPASLAPVVPPSRPINLPPQVSTGCRKNCKN